jgi:hypothetical protein
MMQRAHIAFFISLAISACYSTKTRDGPVTVTLSDELVQAAVFELDYVESAAPAVAPLKGGLHPFKVAARNARRLLGSSVSGEVQMPMHLDQMGVIPESLARMSYADADIEAISERTLETPASEETRVFHVLFLDGMYQDEDGKMRPKVLGAHLSGFDVLAIFTSVIRRSGHQPDILALVQQAALVHELGHAIGLVDEGLAMQSPHHDDSHPGHCTNPNCVMSHLATLPSTALTAVDDSFAPILFGSECLQDVDTLSP